MTTCIATPREVEPTRQAARPQAAPAETERLTAPLVDIFETAEGLTLVADIPGVTEDAISVSIEKDVLTIRAAAPATVERPYAWREFESNGYMRQFRLGNKIDQTGIVASYRNGVLRLQLPFAAEAKPRQISVKVD